MNNIILSPFENARYSGAVRVLADNQRPDTSALVYAGTPSWFWDMLRVKWALDAAALKRCAVRYGPKLALHRLRAFIRPTKRDRRRPWVRNLLALEVETLERARARLR